LNGLLKLSRCCREATNESLVPLSGKPPSKVSSYLAFAAFLAAFFSAFRRFFFSLAVSFSLLIGLGP
jgi:hypothetical protein